MLQTLAIPLAIVVAGALIAGAVFLSNRQPASGIPQPQAVDIKDVKITERDAYIGDVNAPVTLAYWFDYQCPFCKAVDVGGVEGIPIEPAMPMLVKDYVNTGKLRIVFKDYAFLGEDSTIAALYAQAVWEKYPQRFYEWHEAMFHAQDEEHGGFGNEASIIELIDGLGGFDSAALKSLVASKQQEYLGYIQEDITEGSSFGISGTPGFITGKKLISGADQPAAFKAAIDEQL